MSQKNSKAIAMIVGFEVLLLKSSLRRQWRPSPFFG